MARTPTLEDWSLYDEHLDEAAFCWRQWLSAICAPHYSLVEVEAGPEERLLAHMDALVIGGRAVAERMLLPALESSEPALAGAAALALLAAEDGDFLDPILASLESEHENATAIGRALASDRRAVHAKRLARAWDGANAGIRAWLLEPLAAMMPRAWLLEQLASCAASSDATLAELALRRVWNTPDPAFESIVRAKLSSSTPAVRRAAIVAALVLGLPEAWQACRAAARGPDVDRSLLAVQCAAGSSELLKSVYSRFDAGEHSEDLLWALGFAGTHEAAERLVSRLDDRDHAALAGDSLATITGLRIEAGLSLPPGPEPTLDPDAPPPRLEAKDFLPVPYGAAVRRAWSEIEPRFVHNARYVLGVPAEPSGLRMALEHCGSWRREVFAIACALNRKTGLPIELNDWAHAQRNRLRAATR